MLEEQKEVVPTATEPETPETPVEANEPSGNEPSGEAEGEAPKIENKIDYEAQLQKERDARKKAEEALARKRFKGNREEPEAPIIEEVDEEDRPLTKRELQEILARNTQDVEKRVMGTQIKAIANEIASTPLEAELIVEIHKNRVWPEHLSIEEQLEEAQLIANKKSFKGKLSEMHRALRGRGGINTNPAGTHVDGPRPAEPQVAATTKQVLAESGFKWNGTSRRYEKKTANGQTLIRDPKTGSVRRLA